jgi:hypothetical protein
MNTEQLLQEFVDRLRLAAPNNVDAIVLYGSAARKEFDTQYSDLNVLCVLKSLAPEQMTALQPLIRWWVTENRQRPPLFWTASELRESADVFAIELLEIKEAHRLLFGTDVISAINVPMNLHRVEVERELRIALLKLRQHYIVANSDHKELAAVLAKSALAMKTLLRHALIACGEAAPQGREELLARIAQAFAIDVSGIRDAFRSRDQGSRQQNPEKTYLLFMNSLESIINKIESLAPKREWQRVV